MLLYNVSKLCYLENEKNKKNLSMLLVQIYNIFFKESMELLCKVSFRNINYLNKKIHFSDNYSWYNMYFYNGKNKKIYIS